MNTKSQEALINCLLCGKNSKGFVLCKKCASDPFLVEDARAKTIANKNYNLFRKLYSKDYAEIKNTNSTNFWNKHFEKEQSFDTQDQMTRDKIKKIVSLLPKNAHQILDIGFGQGYFEEVVVKKRKDINITGIDISSSAVRRANRKFKGKYIQGDLRKIKKNFTKDSFDVILAIEVIEHISPKNIFNFFFDANYLLKPNGRLIISTPLNEHLRDTKENKSGHVRDYSTGVISEELRESGFSVSAVHTLYAFKKLYRIKKSFVGILNKRWEANNVVIKAIKISSIKNTTGKIDKE